MDDRDGLMMVAMVLLTIANEGTAEEKKHASRNICFLDHDLISKYMDRAALAQVTIMEALKKYNDGK